MLTYHHFNVKLPYYKEASEGKFNLEKSKKEFQKHLSELCELTGDVKMGQIKFQKLEKKKKNSVKKPDSELHD